MKRKKSRFRNIIYGMNTVMDIYPHRISGRLGNFFQSDTEALNQDWNRIGKDLAITINKAGYDEEEK